MTSRIAQTLRGLSLRPSLESDVEASAVTGDGDQITKVEVEEPQQTPADGAAAPGEDQEVTATVVETAEGAETETAETVATDSEVVASTESETADGEATPTGDATPAAEVGEVQADADTTTGDGEQVVQAAVEPAQELPADGAAAPGEDQQVEAVVVEVAEGAETESAETEVTDSEVTVSQEGLAGAVVGFLVGAAGWTPFVGAAIHGAAKAKRLKLREDIQTIAKRIAAVRKGQIEKAKKEGLELPKKLEDVDYIEIIKSAFLGQFFGGFYGAWQGGDMEELNKELKAKLKELESELDAAGISNESFADGEAAPADLEAEANAAAAAAAAHVAEGAAAAAEAAAAAAAAVTGEEPAADAADAAADAGEATSEAAEEAEVAAADASELDSDEEAKAIEDGHAEIEAAAQDIEDGEAHAEEYEQAAATMESLVDALRDAQKTGGLTPQSAQFFNIGFESIGIRLTGKPFQNAHGEAAIPSLESFGGSMRRDAATQISMEAASDWLKKIWEVLKKTFQQIKAWVIKFIQAVFDQAARFEARADKIIAKAKAASGDAKNATIELGRAGSKIARNGKVDTADLADLVMLAEEATVRSKEGSDAIAKIRGFMNQAVTELAKADPDSVDYEQLFTGRLGVVGGVLSGDLKSPAFSEPYEDGDKKGFQTDLLPGNVRLAVIDPASEGPLRMLLALSRGWRVVTIQGEEQEVGAVPTLDLGQIVTVAENVKKAIAASKKAKDNLKTEALDLGSISIAADVPEANAKVIQQFVSASAKSVSTASSSIGTLLKYVVGTSGYYLDYAAASLKQYGVKVEAAAPAALPAA